MTSHTFTIHFDGQFWVGVLELDDGTHVRAARHVFGPEPTDAELLDFARTGYVGLAERADAAVAVPRADRPVERVANPKRLARLAAREQARRGPSTRARDALKATIAAAKEERRAACRERREAEAEAKRARARERARARHRGH